MCVCAHACVCTRDVFAIYDNNILPRLIMIIIKVIILYFIQVRHTDDCPSTGTRLVLLILSQFFISTNIDELSTILCLCMLLGYY